MHVHAVQILKEPDTFRDHATPEEQQLFDRARTACLRIWHDISNAPPSHKDCNGLAGNAEASATLCLAR